MGTACIYTAAQRSKCMYTFYILFFFSLLCFTFVLDFGWTITSIRLLLLLHGISIQEAFFRILIGRKKANQIQWCLDEKLHIITHTCSLIHALKRIHVYVYQYQWSVYISSLCFLSLSLGKRSYNLIEQTYFWHYLPI